MEIHEAAAVEGAAAAPLSGAAPVPADEKQAASPVFIPPPPVLTIDGHFKDRDGRVLMLRGVNLSGATKIPTRPNGATHLAENWYDMANVSFVGRPFPLEEADEHFHRLSVWGLRFLRFLVTWEAIEHTGPSY